MFLSSTTTILTTLLINLALFTPTNAQSTTSASTTPSTSSSSSSSPSSTSVASILLSYKTYTYVGCYGETTLTNGTAGARALSDGTSTSDVTMTVQGCLNICTSGGYAYGGVEYTSECYCAPYLSSLAPLLSDNNCNLACKGNASQICGGDLRLSVYHAVKAQGSGGEGVLDGRKSVLALAFALAVALVIA